MNLLLVDDEVLAVETIGRLINWEYIGIENIFTAYNVVKAKELLKEKSIDILLCDIEMPLGNGLELLQWVREQKIPVECIFLTCHAEFSYAKEALRLGSSDYLIKPVIPEELELLIKNLILKINMKREVEKYKHFGQKWVNTSKDRVGYFWKDIILGSTALTSREITNRAERYGISVDLETNYQVALYAIKYIPDSLRAWEIGVLDFALKNVASETIAKQAGAVFFPIAYELYCFMVPEDQINKEEELSEKSFEFIHWCKLNFGCKIVCYVDQSVNILSLPSQIESLLQFNSKNVVTDSGVYYYQSMRETESVYKKPNIKLWEMLIRQGKWDKLKRKMKNYVEEVKKQHALNENTLTRLVHEFYNLIYEMVGSEKISNIFGKREHELYKKALNSDEDAMIYFTYILDVLSLEEKGDVPDAPETIVEQIKKYVKQNINEEISREDLSEMVHLNPDYLNRIFKKEVGMSLTEYVISCKINIAKELLEMTDMPIGEIGAQIGYHNFAYFSNYFKKITGFGPAAYRKEMQK